jgi:hypothetical protein
MKAVLFISLILGMLICAPVMPGYAQVVSPLQSGHYLPGVTNIRDMAYPPPGLFVMWYNVWISSDTYVDRNGNNLTGLRLGKPAPSLLDIDLGFDIGAFTTVPALFWASKPVFPGGACYLAGISPNYLTADGTVTAQAGGGVKDSTITKVEEGSVSGFSDLFVVPVGLSWGREQYDVTLTYGFYAPTGKYSTGGTDNAGLGYWTHQLQGYGYYYLSPDRATALMLGLTYELNGTVEDADVKPGSRFSLEYGLSQYFTKQIEVGVQGGHNWQVSDDNGSDVLWDPGIHDRKNMLAFSASYWPWKDRLYLSLKYGFDYANRQRFDNSYWMLNAIFLTDLLTGS